jgi:hypothetical protein
MKGRGNKMIIWVVDQDKKGKDIRWIIRYKNWNRNKIINNKK